MVVVIIKMLVCFITVKIGWTIKMANLNNDKKNYSLDLAELRAPLMFIYVFIACAILLFGFFLCFLLIDLTLNNQEMNGQIVEIKCNKTTIALHSCASVDKFYLISYITDNTEKYVVSGPRGTRLIYPSHLSSKGYNVGDNVSLIRGKLSNEVILSTDIWERTGVAFLVTLLGITTFFHSMKLILKLRGHKKPPQ